MENKWQLDKQQIIGYIKKGKSLLKNPHLPKSERKIIKEEIKTFTQFLAGDFTNHTDYAKNYTSIEKLKQYILSKMQKQYVMFGKELIDWIIALNQERIFEEQYLWDQTELSIEAQSELTLKNYQKNSLKLLGYAEQILSSNPIPQIQLAENLDSSSYCYYSDIAQLSFLIIDPSEASYILNHEVEHGIENALNFNTHSLFDELGSTYFELLFLDTLYEEQGYLLGGDYDSRIEEASGNIRFLAKYFNVMKIFAAADFQISMEMFKATFSEIFNVSPKYLREFLNEEIAGNLQIDMSYLFSYLKAIELRKFSKENNIDSFDILKPYLKSRKFNFNLPQNSFAIYETFIEEMEQKRKL